MLIAWFVIFIIVVVGLGIWAKRAVKTTEDYSIAGRRMGPWVIAFAFLAAQIAVSNCAVAPSLIYKMGLSGVWLFWAGALSPLLLFPLMAYRLSKLSQITKTTTIPDTFAVRYYDKGNIVRLTTSVILIFAIFLYFIGITVAVGWLMQSIFGVPYWGAIILVAAMMAVYLGASGTLGGTWIAVLEGVVGTAVAVGVGIFAATQLGGYSGAMAGLEAISPKLLNPWVFGVPYLVSLLTFGWVAFGYPPMVDRYYAMRNPKDARNATLIAVIFITIINIGIFWAAMYSKIALPPLDNPEMTYYRFVTALPPALGGLFAAAVIGILIGTLHFQVSFLGNTIMRDFVQGAARWKGDTARALRLARIIMIIVIVVGAAVAINPPATLYAILGWTFSLIAGGVGMPMLYGLYWKRATKQATLGTLIICFVFGMLWNTIPAIPAAFPPMFAPFPNLVLGAIIFPIISLLTPKPPLEIQNLVEQLSTKRELKEIMTGKAEPTA